MVKEHNKAKEEPCWQFITTLRDTISCLPDRYANVYPPTNTQAWK